MLKRRFYDCLHVHYTHTNEGVDYCIKVVGNTIKIFFECSDGKEDWLSNFNFPSVSYKRGTCKWRCHRGFLRKWKTVREAIESEVGALIALNDAKLIEVIGYSHGAALALLCHEDMQYHYGGWVAVRGYGFGCPRVIWGKIPDEVRARLLFFTDIQNGRDIVTHVPPKLFGFTDAFGFRVKLDTEHKYGPFEAHYPDKYLDELEKLDD